MAAEQEENQVIEVARDRAQETLEAARELADEKMTTAGATRTFQMKVASERTAADEVVAEERVAADERLRVERREHQRALSALLRLERDATTTGYFAGPHHADDLTRRGRDGLPVKLDHEF
jgi:hypothetical protein